jgi:hypothetical protein
MALHVPGDRRVLSLPAIGVALMPKLVCPACWPAYGALLSSLGLGFIPTALYLFPLTLVFLALAVTPLGTAAWTTRQRLPFALGLIASVGIVAGKFAFESKATTYLGVALLVTAWLRPRPARACPSCAPAGASGIPKERTGVSY